MKHTWPTIPAGAEFSGIRGRGAPQAIMVYMYLYASELSIYSIVLKSTEYHAVPPPGPRPITDRQDHCSFYRQTEWIGNAR